MKKYICLCISVIFLLSFSLHGVYALPSENIEFVCNNKTYNYSLAGNEKSSEQFDVDYELNKYNRFDTTEDRRILLTKMLNAGFDKDVALTYLFPNIDKKIDNIAKSIDSSPIDATERIDTNSEKVFFISKEKHGYLVDKHDIYSSLVERYLKNENLSVDVQVKKLEPKIKSEFLSKHAKLRADFSTDISSSSVDRKHNIKNAINSINKIEILPDQVFSFNNTVGRRTKENGYRQAKIIVNDEFVEGLGGGVCQVSTTLYNSALLAGLNILEANKHSKQVGYVKSGFDAMVNFGSSDLKFRNNTNEKLTIVANYSPSRIRIRIFGEDMGDIKYKLVNEVFNIVEPGENVRIDTAGEFSDKVKYEDEYFVEKRGSRGVEVKSYREKYVNGELVDKTLLRHDKFKVQNRVVVYGAEPRYEKTPEESGV